MWRFFEGGILDGLAGTTEGLAEGMEGAKTRVEVSEEAGSET